MIFCRDTAPAVSANVLIKHKKTARKCRFFVSDTPEGCPYGIELENSVLYSFQFILFKFKLKSTACRAES